MKDCNCATKCTTCKCDLDAISDLMAGRIKTAEDNSEDPTEDEEDTAQTEDASQQISEEPMGVDESETGMESEARTEPKPSKKHGIDSILDDLFAPADRQGISEEETSETEKSDIADETSDAIPQISEDDIDCIDDPEERIAIEEVQAEELMEREIRKVEATERKFVLENMPEEGTMPDDDIAPEIDDCEEQISEEEIEVKTCIEDWAESNCDADDKAEMETETVTVSPATENMGSEEKSEDETAPNREYIDPISREYKLWQNNILGCRLY